jgi:hypothetical protein
VRLGGPGKLLAAWGGTFGGSDPAAADRQFVTAGLADRPPAPWAGALHGGTLGSAAFAERLRREVGKNPPRERRREARQALRIDRVRATHVVSRFYNNDPRRG